MSTEPNLDLLSRLNQIRDLSVSARNTSGGGALLQESYAAFNSFSKGLSLPDVRQAILEGDILRNVSYASRRRVFTSISHRYFAICPEWITRSLVRAAKKGPQSVEFLSLAYLYFALRDRLAFDFITGPVWEKWHRKTTTIDRQDFLTFLQEKSETAVEIKQWRETTRRKLATNALSSLRDFGLLKGVQKKQIQRPSISAETVFHLLCILLSEGLEGGSVIEAPDWRLFLWSETEVARALGDLAQKHWLKFERSGRAVELELIRKPEVET